jgi:hypothetical protein
MPYAEEPDEADKIIVKIQSLGQSHAVYPYAVEIKQKADAVRNAINLYKEAIRSEKAAEAELEIAKTDLACQYEHNYLDARKKLGDVEAERLFPSLTSQKKDASSDDSGAQTNAAQQTEAKVQ